MIYGIHFYLPPYEFEIDLFVSLGMLWNIKFQANSLIYYVHFNSSKLKGSKRPLRDNDRISWKLVRLEDMAMSRVLLCRRQHFNLALYIG